MNELDFNKIKNFLGLPGTLLTKEKNVYGMEDNSHKANIRYSCPEFINSFGNSATERLSNF